MNTGESLKTTHEGKTTLDAWRLLDNVVHLTGHKDRHALESHLVNTLAQLITAEEISLYESRVRDGERVFRAMARVDPPVA